MFFNITDASDHNGAKTAAYAYDDLYRLTSATITNTANSQDYTHEYTYDIIGNVLTRTDAAGTYVYEGNDSGTSGNTMANPHAVTGIDTTTYTYDNNGNLTSDGTWTYTWNQKNWLTGATDGTTTLDYLYDESGERAIKNNQTTSTQSRYINKYYELDATVPQTHVYAGDMKAATVQNGTDVVFHHSDHLTGTNVDTDESGAILEVLDYYPYGNVRLDDQAGSYENPYKYTGKELDEETDLYYYGARYYNANIGRFVSQDPWGGDIKDPQSLNKYSYVMNNPMKYNDPTGMLPGDLFISMDQAAIDFGLNYNDNSYRDNREYSSSIYSLMDESGNIFYSYTVPLVGIKNASFASLPLNGEPVTGLIHTHDRYDSEDSNIFSDEDKAQANYYEVSSYLSSPNGTLQKYDPWTSEINIIYGGSESHPHQGLPSDPMDPSRTNDINPNNLPGDEPSLLDLDVINKLQEFSLKRAGNNNNSQKDVSNNKQDNFNNTYASKSK